LQEEKQVHPQLWILSNQGLFISKLKNIREGKLNYIIKISE